MKGRTVVALMTALIVVSAALIGPTALASEDASRRPERTADRIVYPGDGVDIWRASGDLRLISGTPKDFRRFVSKRLDSLWRSTGSDPSCAHTPLVSVKEVRRKNAYIDNEGVFGGDDPETTHCSGGGAHTLYVKRQGHWRAPAALGGQEPLACGVLRRWDLPRMNGAKVCYAGTTIVRYEP